MVGRDLGSDAGALALRREGYWDCRYCCTEATAVSLG